MKKITLIMAMIVMAFGAGMADNPLSSILKGLGSAASGSTSSSTESTDDTSSSSSSSSNSQSLLGSLLSSLVGENTTVTQDKIIGTWNYTSPDCRFTSENALAQAGGAVAASTVEEKLASVYSAINLKEGNTSFTFNEDNTCVMVLGGKTINGTYTLDSDTRALNMKSNTGIIKLNAQVYYSYTTLTLLYDANKLMSIIKMLSTITGKTSSTLSTVNSLLQNYDGLMIGMNLQK